MKDPGIKFDEIADQVIADSGPDPEQQPQPETGSGPDKTVRVLRATVEKLEIALNEYLKSRDPGLSLTETELKQHSELLSDVLEKNLSMDLLKNSPEFALLAYSVVMVSQRIPIVQRIRAGVKNSDSVKKDPEKSGEWYEKEKSK